MIEAILREFSAWSAATTALALFAVALVWRIISMGQPHLYKVNEEGLSLWCGSGYGEFLALKREFFADTGIIYLSHGVSVKEGDTVLDVGANNGFFVVSLLERFSNIHVHCFEPVPFTYQNLSRNVQTWLNNHPKSKSTVQTNEMGLSDAPGRLKFKQNPVFTVMGRSENDEGEFGKIMTNSMIKDPVHALCCLVHDIKRAELISQPTADRIQAFFRIPVLGFIAAASLAVLPITFHMLVDLIHGRWVDCKLDTVSAVVKEQKIDRIDLLKVDVEGAEHLVIGGVSDADWNKVQQVVMEVHDMDGRVEKLDKLLKSKGFKTVVEQEDSLSLQTFHVYSIFAVRK